MTGRMVQTQISLRADQAERLRRIAVEESTSMAGLIRRAVDSAYPPDPDNTLEARYARAMGAVGIGDSGLSDVSERHDHYLAESILGDR